MNVERKVKVTLGICMDLSPYKFEAPFTAFELAKFTRAQGSQLLLCSMAWLDSTPSDPKEEEEEMGLRAEEEDGESKSDRQDGGAKGPDGDDGGHGILEYWKARVVPLWGSEIGFVICNRTGKEKSKPRPASLVFFIWTNSVLYFRCRSL